MILRWLTRDPLGRLYAAVTLAAWVLVWALWAFGVNA